MQRMLSIGTLAVLGGLAWLFLSEGSQQGLTLPPGVRDSTGSQPSATYPQVNWPNSPPSPHQGAAHGSWPASPQTQQVFLPTSTGGATPPLSGPAIRIASFNIKVFGQAKAQNQAVMLTLAEIVRRFDVVAIQEIRTQDDYHIPNFLRWVNQPGRRYESLVGPRIGNTKSTEQYAFIFDADRIEIDWSSHYTVRDPDNMLHREPHVASFRVRGVPPEEAFTFTLINVHVDPDIVEYELDGLAEVYRVVRRAGKDEDDVIMVGDFNVDDRRMGRLTQIPGVTPLISGVYTNTNQNALYDNLVIHQASTTEYTGHSGVFDVMREFNLSQQEALQVSDHLPVWAEFSAYERDVAGRIARRAPVYR